MIKRIKAFDHSAVHLGNRGLGIDYDALEPQLDTLLANMTQQQKLNELRGRQKHPIDGLYYAGGEQTLGIPAFKMVDGPRGARTGSATAFPVAIARAASFDVMLERRVGLAIGLEVAAKGGNVLLAPTINLLRHPGWGRAQETYSEDSHHMGAMAAAFVSGAQNYVLTSPKHFALNNLENTRFDLSADIGSRALHELYLPHFKRCVIEAGAASIMSAYNKVNDIYSGEQPWLLEQILRQDWGFKGFVESDWFLGTRSTAASLNAGMDIEMPAGFRYSDEKLQQALLSGELEQATIDRSVRRIVRQKMAWKLAEMTAPAPEVVECDAHRALAEDVAAQSLVLLKNNQQLLPLRDQSGLKVALVGDLAGQVNLGDRGSSFVTSTTVSTIKDGLEEVIEYGQIDFYPETEDWSALEQADVTLVVAGLTYRDEGEFIPNMQAEAEGGNLARGGDRAQLSLPQQQRQLIERAIKHSDKVVVLLQGGSAITVGDWIESIEALMMVWYPGCEGGRAVARTVFGQRNDFGRLPVTIPTGPEQLMPWDVTALTVPHDLLSGYRYLDHYQHTPAFAFGFGLSYTQFELSQGQVSRSQDGFIIEITVINTGPVAGAAVPQLYVSAQDSAVFRVKKELKGFGRVPLAAGEQAVLEIELPDQDLYYYDEDCADWVLEQCRYQLQIGQCSQSLQPLGDWCLDGRGWQQQQ